MRVLTGRGGELLARLGSICDNENCPCNHSLAGLDSAYPIDNVTVADSNLTPETLEQKCAELLHRTGWAETLGPNDTAELAADMAAGAIQGASGYPVGTRLAPRFDFTAEQWAYAIA
jgi:hypothetical protein